MDIKIIQTASKVIEHLQKIGFRVVTAESCTGGLIAASLTAIPGSSNVFDRAFIVYSNVSKSQELSVPFSLIEKYGAVSKEVVMAMAEGALARSYPHTHISVAVSGVAGPTGSPQKPVGLVHFAVARRGDFPSYHEFHEFGNISREEVRNKTTEIALELLLKLTEKD